jgi:hypothetical protein
MLRWLFANRRLRHAIVSIILSTILIGILVGNAYIATSIGYPHSLQPIGSALIQIGFVVGMPAFVGFLGLQKLGLGWELRGRESFIESNIGLWIYCIIFYALIFYLVARIWYRYWSRLKERHSSLLKSNNL